MSISATKLLGLNKSEILELILSSKAFTKPYQASQIFDAIYRQGCTDPRQITTLSLHQRSLLTIGLPHSALETISKDGTRKYLLNSETETVFIPNKSKGTLCVSSQVGCSMRCSFCHTGTQKFKKNLKCNEIVGQFMHAMHALGEFPIQKRKPRAITNLVFMGQGEPLYNFKEVSKAIKFINETFGYSSWRTTISTCGVVPLMEKVGSELQATLAVSLHAVNDELRDELVPINKQFPIRELLVGCERYLAAVADKYSQQQRITFEYVMLDGINDTLHDAKELVRLLRKMKCHVNLIPFNPWPGSQYTCSSFQKIHMFQKILRDANIQCNIRQSRGSDILAACGQLKSLAENKKFFNSVK